MCMEYGVEITLKSLLPTFDRRNGLFNLRHFVASDLQQPFIEDEKTLATLRKIVERDEYYFVEKPSQLPNPTFKITRYTQSHLRYKYLFEQCSCCQQYKFDPDSALSTQQSPYFCKSCAKDYHSCTCLSCGNIFVLPNIEIYDEKAPFLCDTCCDASCYN